MLTGILVSLIFGIKMDITFKGGSILKYAYEGSIDLSQAQSVVAAAIQNEVTIQETTNLGDNKTFLVVNVAGTQALTPDEQIALKNALVTTFPDTTFTLESANLVDPFIGRELLIKGLWAIALASILIVAFVWFSFRSMSGPSAGMMGLVALFHDVFVAFFMFVILRIPLNESLVAVVLTILGFRSTTPSLSTTGSGKRTPLQRQNAAVRTGRPLDQPVPEPLDQHQPGHLWCHWHRIYLCVFLQHR